MPEKWPQRLTRWKEFTISEFIRNALGQVITGAIVSIGLIAVVVAFTGRWPDLYLLLCASIGTALSPFFWRTVRWAQGIPLDAHGVPIDPNAEEQSEVVQRDQ